MTNHMDSLFRMSTVDISDRLNAMLEAERKPHYRCRDYLHHRSRSSISMPMPSQRSTPSSSKQQRRQRPRQPTITPITPITSITPIKNLITPASRGKIVQWLYDCVDYLELQRECVAVAMGYVDQFMSISMDDNNNDGDNNDGMPGCGCRRDHERVVARAAANATVYQLVAISALFLAAKQSDVKLTTIDAEVLARVSHGSYSANEILDMENTLLDALRWRVCRPTALGVAHHVIALLNKRSSSSRTGASPDDVDRRRRRTASVLDFTRLQIELSVSDYDASVLRRPSAVALASVLNSMELLDFTSRERRDLARALADWTHPKYWTGGMDPRSAEVDTTRVVLRRVFDRRSDDVVSRAAAASSPNDEKDSPSVGSSRSPTGVAFTPRSSTDGGRSKRERRRKPGPSPTCVDAASFGRLKLEP